MKPLKFILFFVLQFFFCLVSYCQKERIDSLKRVLPTLIDTARIDCLNNIAAYYLMSMQKDSSDYFIKLVAEESGKINYKHGMACSYMLRAGFVNHFHNDFTSMKELALEALKWHNLTPNKKEDRKSVV